MSEEFKSFFKNVGGGEGARCKYPVRLDTYGKGCSHDCRYCYAKSLLDFRKLWNPLSPAVADKELAHIQITVTSTDDELSLKYEKAVVPSRRISAIERLQDAGFDVALRLSPFIPEFVDLDKLNAVRCDKIQVEFLRVNTWVKKWFGEMVDFSNHIIKQGGYLHLPLEMKKELMKGIKFKEISVCEDEDSAYEYWKNNFNPNKNDCCNLRK